MANPEVCPWCGLSLSEHAPAWTCGSFPGWEGGAPHQSIACAQIAQLKVRVETALIWIKNRKMCSKTQYTIGKNQMQELINILEAP